MNWKAVVLALLTLGVIAGGVASGPLRPWKSARYKILPKQPKKFKHAFEGGKRACVIVLGDHDPVMDITIKVFDEESGRLVAKDEKGGDICAAIWYPARDAMFRIEVAVHGNVWNNCYISLK